MGDKERASTKSVKKVITTLGRPLGNGTSLFPLKEVLANLSTNPTTGYLCTKLRGKITKVCIFFRALKKPTFNSSLCFSTWQYYAS